MALRLLSGNAIDRSRAFAAFSAQYPDFIDYLFEREETRLSFGGRDELIVLLWLLSSMWWFQLATDGAAGVNCCVGCDEGFSQRGLSLLAYREVPTTDAWERSVREYFQCMPKPDTVVVPFASFDVALERMGLRHQGYPTRVQGLLPSEQRAVFERASRCVELGADELGRRGVRVIRLENEGTREDLRPIGGGCVARACQYSGCLTRRETGSPGTTCRDVRCELSASVPRRQREAGAPAGVRPS